MADKNFKVKSGLNIPIASAAILTTDANGNISSTATLPISAGGTGQTSATNAINALLPVQNGSTVNYALQSDGSNVNWGKLYNQTIKNNGTTVTPRGIVNVVGATFSDDSGTDTTTITFTDTTGVSTSGGSTITAASASTKGLTIQGAASQTANLQEWQNSSGTVLASITQTGNGRFSYLSGQSGVLQSLTGLLASTNLTNRVNLTVQAIASQTANLQEWQNSSGTAYTYIGSPTTTGQGPSIPLVFSSSGVGQIKWGNNTVWSLGLISGQTNVMYPWSNDRTALIIQGLASQSANLQEWWNSSGTVLAKISAAGQITSNVQSSSTISTPLILQNNAYGIGTGTALTMNYGGLDFASIESAYSTSPGAGGAYLAFKTNHNAGASSTTKLLIDNQGTVTINGFVAGAQGLIVKGAASQTADLQQWQDNAGTVKAKLSSGGSFSGYNNNYFARTYFLQDGATDSSPQFTGAYFTAASSNSAIYARPLSASITPLAIQGAASQTADLQQWQNSSGTVLSKITNSGGIYVEGGGAASQINGTFGQLSIRAGGTTPASATIGTGYGAGVGLVIFGAASQSANLQEWWNNVSGTILAKVDSSGSMFTTTAAAGTNTTQVATTAFVKTAIDNLIASAPGTLDTLDEIAQALNDDPNFYTTITTLTNALAEQDSYTLMGVF